MSENGFRKGEWQDGQWEPSDDDDADGMPVGPSGRCLSDDDLQLLELAARAIGCVRFEVVESEDYANLHFADGSTIWNWNPLKFSGDTFELGVRLSLFDENATFQHHLATEQSRGGDPLAAAKRAVVLTAAATGATVRTTYR